MKNLHKFKSSPMFQIPFKELETARLYLEYANTLESSGYLYYSDYYQKKITEDEMNAKIADAEPILPHTLSKLTKK